MAAAQTAAGRPNQPNRGTNNNHEPCKSTLARTHCDCDEYPYFSAVTEAELAGAGGRSDVPIGDNAWRRNFSVNRIDRTDNRGEGSKLGQMYNVCPSQRGTTADSPRLPFLVVPMPADAGDALPVDTMWICERDSAP